MRTGRNQSYVPVDLKYTDGSTLSEPPEDPLLWYPGNPYWEITGINSTTAFLFDTTRGDSNTSYQLYLYGPNGQSGTNLTTAWYTQAQVATTNSGVGSITVSGINDGHHYWAMRAKKNNLVSAYSQVFAFKAGMPVPAPVSPNSGGVGTPTTFKWLTVPTATYYYIATYDRSDSSTGPGWWVDASTCGTDFGTSTQTLWGWVEQWSWVVYAYGPRGWSDPSDAMYFQLAPRPTTDFCSIASASTRSDTYWAGFIFSPTSDITVGKLKRLCIGGESNSHTVSIFGTSGVIVSGTVSCSGVGAGNYASVGVADTVLHAGWSYIIASQEGTDTWQSNSTLTASPYISTYGGAYCGGTPTSYYSFTGFGYATTILGTPNAAFYNP